MNRSLLIACWLVVMAGAAWLRFDKLGERPFHADEATGARLTANRMAGEATFDPTHYHGPTQSMIAALACRIAGETKWADMEQGTLRLVPAVAGCLVVLLPVFLRRRIGDPAALAAAALLGSSPLLVYYSRMFIHETLLCLFGMAALVSLLTKPKSILPGVFLGLMFATKATVAITVLAAGFALLCVWFGTRPRKTLAELMQEWCKPFVSWAIAGFLVSALCYTDVLRHPQGLLDAFTTFFRYETVAGHEKSFTYYLRLLALPIDAAGYWWYGTPVIFLAAAGWIRSFGKRDEAAMVARFTGFALLGHLAIYSFIAYKTPWLMCLPWALACLLAASAVRLADGMQTGLIVAAVTAWALFSQARQAITATGRLASDARNPFAYVPTRRDADDLGAWLEALRETSRTDAFPCAVVGTGYWPLPWILRRLETVGYHSEPVADMSAMACVIAMPEQAGAVASLLENTHIALPRGLRPGVPIIVHVRNDIWETWIAQP
jgi:uncharacterized protein (TIGR03663 family)